MIDEQTQRRRLLAKALMLAVEEKDASLELIDVAKRAKQYCKATVPDADRIELAAMLGTKLKDLLGVTFHDKTNADK
jgi:hypothetical protein